MNDKDAYAVLRLSTNVSEHNMDLKKLVARPDKQSRVARSILGRTCDLGAPQFRALRNDSHNHIKITSYQNKTLNGFSKVLFDSCGLCA